ncbi:hypothetical protein D1871_14735 [Nakamurella silvestris]|nr:hypothetical protein D1871_14735 [Nakamurella silvestris]
MSEFMTTLAISLSILAMMVLTQFGRREYTARAAVRPLVVVLVLGYIYLKDAPISGPEVLLYAAGIGIGLVFAVLATISTRLELDPESGRRYTLCGAGFVATWLVAVAVRIAFVWSVDNLEGFRNAVGTFMYQHQLAEGSIAPFFVLMALATVLGRTVAVRMRVNALGRADAVRTGAGDLTASV